jgi:hypothetical protein
MKLTFSLPVAAMIGLGACVPTTPAPVVTNPGVPEALIAADEQLCLDSVARQTGNAVRIVDTQALPGETTVYVGVGSQNTQFVCRVLNGRVTAVTAL